MSPLWLMLALAVIVGLVLAWPWLRRRLPEEQARRAANVAAYRTRVAELDADVQVGSTDVETAEALRDEAAARLLADEVDDARPARGRRRHRALGVGLAVVPVVIAVAWYIQDGSWRTAQEIALGHVTHQEVTASKKQQTQNIEAMVERLHADLKQHPDSADRWALLGRSETVLENYSASVKAYAQANRLSAQSNPEWLVAQGLAQGMVQGRSLQGGPAALFATALRVAPDDARALWYAGVAAAQGGDGARARQLWTTLASQPNVPADVHTAIENQIANLGGDAASARAPDVAPVVLNVKVRVAPELMAGLPAAATLFVYVRAVGGPPMPVAARRVRNPRFPLAVRLDDSNRPMPGVRLEGHAKLQVIARLSRTGTAKPASGDLQGAVEVDGHSPADPVMLMLDQRLP